MLFGKMSDTSDRVYKMSVHMKNYKVQEEEKERLKELQNTPFTDYQKEVLKQNSVKSALSREVEQKNRSFPCTINRIIRLIMHRNRYRRS